MPFERPQLKTEKEPSALEVFRTEIALLKKEALTQKAKGLSYDPHLEVIEPGELTREDAEIYYKINDGTLTEAEYCQYFDKITKIDENPKVDSETKERRLNFRGFLADLIEEVGVANRWRAEKFKRENPGEV